MIACRAETTLAETLKEFSSDKEDARMLVKQIFTSEADLIPDKEKNIDHSIASPDLQITRHCNKKALFRTQ
jgi:hypothetical protein